MKEMDNFDGGNHVYTKVIKKDFRTYFLDVRLTKRGQHYVTITESRKKFDQNNGKMYFDKHKVFIYREDFEEIKEALSDVMEYADNKNKKLSSEKPNIDIAKQEESTPINLSFEDLGKE